MTMNIPASTLLIALALGYIVCVLAKKEEKALKSIGYIIGTSIIIVSSVLILAKLLLTITIYGNICGKNPQHWMMQRRHMMKPDMQPGMMQQTPVAPAKKP